MIFLVPFFLLQACDDDQNGNELIGEHTYTFDQNLENWNVHGIDLVVDGNEVNWHIQHSPDTSYEGEGSARFYLENYTDAGKIWLERSYDLEANSKYKVEIVFQFGTLDFGDINLWTIIAGAYPSSPENRDALHYRDDTGGSPARDSLAWIPKSYQEEVETNSSGKIFVTVGVWGTWETPRTYYMDNLEVRIRKK